MIFIDTRVQHSHSPAASVVTRFPGYIGTNHAGAFGQRRRNGDVLANLNHHRVFRKGLQRSSVHRYGQIGNILVFFYISRIHPRQ